MPEVCHSEAEENVIGYSIAHDTSPMMLVSGDLKLLKDFKTIKIDNLIDNSNLREKIIAETDNRHSRRTGDTAELIDFLGGFLRISGCHNANSLRSLPIKKLFLDELDAYPQTLAGEGSPIDLAVKRTESYSRTRKIGYISTPLLSCTSHIKEYYENKPCAMGACSQSQASRQGEVCRSEAEEKGDQRKFYVPCPFCGEKQELIFYSHDEGLYSDDKAISEIENGKLKIENYNNTNNYNQNSNYSSSSFNIKRKPYGLIFNLEQCKNGDYSSVVYRCKYCGCDMKDYHKKKMLIKGEWMPTAAAKKPHYRSYHLSALYSLFKSWEDCVSDFLEAGKDPIKLQSFYNLTLGLPYEETIAGVEIYKLRKLKEENRNNNVIPEEALFLVGACDVQDDRLEVENKPCAMGACLQSQASRQGEVCRSEAEEIKAYGDRWRSWGIDHRVIKGNTSNPFDNCWTELFRIKDEIFHNGMLVKAILIDSGDGEKTDLVYKFCQRDDERVFVSVKGVNTTALTNKKFNLKELDSYSGLYLLEIYVSLYKNQIARYLNSEWRENEPYPDGYMTFGKEYSEEYFRQLTTERRIKEKLSNGSINIKWEQHRRNEAFDLCVYCLCGAEFLVNELIKNGQFENSREVFQYLKQEKQKQ